MSLEIILEWDKEKPLEQVQEVRVTINVKEVHGIGLKDQYSGFLPTLEIADDYVARLIRNVLSSSEEEVHYADSTQISSEFGVFKVSHYDTSESGKKTKVIKTDDLKNYLIEASSSTSPKECKLALLQDMLERLEKRWYIVTRDETVSDCDYWRGFFSTANGIWHDSNYPAGSPAEKALQIAYELAAGIRDYMHDQKWQFPGPFMPHLQEEPQKAKIVRSIGELLLTGTGNAVRKEADVVKIITGLRDLARQYDEDSKAG